MILTLFALQLQAAAPQTYPGHGKPAVAAPRVAREIVVDGMLSEPEWERAARLSEFSQYQPADGRPAVEPTEIRVMYSAKALYFGIVAHAPGRKVNATLAKRDNIGNDDRVIFYLDTFNDRRRAFMFGVNPLGVQTDGVRSEGGGSAGSFMGGNIDFSPDYRFDSKGRLTDDGYVVEVRIPFKSLRFPRRGEQHRGLNVSRFNTSTNTEDTWTDAQRSSASFLAQAGTLEGIEDVERGIVTEVQPFVTSSMDGSRNPATGAFDRGNMKGDAGANIRVGFPSVSLDATINPDFSQVESDVGLVTVNERFALFLPEKRPFFLEGIELFSGPGIFMSSGFSQLVYTRQIGSPIAGAKVTGKVGRLGIAYLSALDEGRREDDRALFNVARIRTDFSGSSTAGLTLTDRRVADTSNTVAAADARIVFRKLYYLETQLGESRTTRGGDTHASPIYKMELDRTGRTYGFNYVLAGIGDRFESHAGFVPRNDVVTAHGFNRVAFYGSNPRSPVQSIFIFGGPTRLWRYSDFGKSGAEEGDDMLNISLALRGGWRGSVDLGRQFFTFDQLQLSGLQLPGSGLPFIPYPAPKRITGLLRGNLNVTTPVYKRFNASASVQRAEVPIFDEASEGRETRFSASLGLRPSQKVRVEAQAVSARLTRARDGSEFARVVIPRLKAEVQPFRSLFFRVVSELDDEHVAELRDARTGALLYRNGAPTLAAHDKSLRTDWLISFEPNPGTVAFFGYGNTLGQPEIVVPRRLRREADGFFVKLAYQFRR
jgi:hypothetical protein